MAKGSTRVPAYVPYLVPKLSSPPWMPDRTDHVTSIEGWRRNSKQAKRRVLPQELPIQAWLMYQMRFLLAAESCRAFAPFGGLCAQLNHLCVVLNLSATEGFSFGLAYFRILATRLEETARQRAVSADEFSRLLSYEQLDVKEQARRECALSSRGEFSKGFGKDKGSGKQRKGSLPAQETPQVDTPSASNQSPYRPVFNTQTKGSIPKGKGRWRQ